MLAIRAIGLGLVVVFSLIIAIGTGILCWIDGARPATAVIRSCVAFAGTVAFIITIWLFLESGDQATPAGHGSPGVVLMFVEEHQGQRRG